MQFDVVITIADLGKAYLAPTDSAFPVSPMEGDRDANESCDLHFALSTIDL